MPSETEIIKETFIRELKENLFANYIIFAAYDKDPSFLEKVKDRAIDAVEVLGAAAVAKVGLDNVDPKASKGAAAIVAAGVVIYKLIKNNQKEDLRKKGKAILKFFGEPEEAHNLIVAFVNTLYARFQLAIIEQKNTKNGVTKFAKFFSKNILNVIFNSKKGIEYLGSTGSKLSIALRLAIPEADDNNYGLLKNKEVESKKEKWTIAGICLHSAAFYVENKNPLIIKAIYIRQGNEKYATRNDGKYPPQLFFNASDCNELNHYIPISYERFSTEYKLGDFAKYFDLAATQSLSLNQKEEEKVSPEFKPSPQAIPQPEQTLTQKQKEFLKTLTNPGMQNLFMKISNDERNALIDEVREKEQKVAYDYLKASLIGGIFGFSTGGFYGWCRGTITSWLDLLSAYESVRGLTLGSMGGVVTKYLFFSSSTQSSSNQNKLPPEDILKQPQQDDKQDANFRVMDMV